VSRGLAEASEATTGANLGTREGADVLEGLTGGIQLILLVWAASVCGLLERVGESRAR
jgi:hypothetical protein